MATRNVTRKRKSNGRKITQGGRSHGKHGVCRAEVRKETIGGSPTEVNKRKEKEKRKKRKKKNAGGSKKDSQRRLCSAPCAWIRGILV
ncbi:hypothetical protein QG37_00526 [Candidozyma auris]|nr:hypothetical protein QG37_00526 [[Candida] auris]